MKQPNGAARLSLDNHFAKRLRNKQIAAGRAGGKGCIRSASGQAAMGCKQQPAGNARLAAAATDCDKAAEQRRPAGLNTVRVKKQL
jgi:hypothetical protein